MAIQFASYNDEAMQEGKFYFVEVNKDNVSNLREVKSVLDLINNNTEEINKLKHTQDKIYFTNMFYLEVDSFSEHPFDVWEILKNDDGYEYSTLITHSIEVYKRVEQGKTKLILKSTYPIKKGYLQIY